jgi:hypothetical protein
MKENLKVAGSFFMEVIDVESGAVLSEFQEKNLVVILGHNNLARLLGGDLQGKRIDKISLGTNGTSPALADAAITAPFTKAITSVDYPALNSVKFNWSIEAEDANGMIIREFGLLNVDGVLCARKVRTDIVKTSAVRLVGSWKITFN